MSNYLTSGYPTKVKLGEELFEITTNYRDCIKVLLALDDVDLTNFEKQSILLQIMYRQVPANIEMAIQKALLFLNCGVEEMQGSGMKVYSFCQDDKYIFSAVDQVLQGRLSLGEAVHWWEFVSAFMEMPDDCVMSKIIYYRMRYAAGKLTKEENEIWRKNSKLFLLDIKESNEDVNSRNEFMNRLYGRY